MLEDKIKEAFERHEVLVPDGTRILDAATAQVARVRQRRRRLAAGTTTALCLAIAIMAPFAARWVMPVKQADLLPATKGPVADVTGRPLNFLLLGLDKRAGSTDPPRADAIMIAHVPTDRSRLYLVTLQRDIEVKLPGRKHARLNQAYEDGGFPLAAQTVTALTGVPFDAGATIEYDGVRRLVGALGGVQLCVDQVVRSEHYDAQGRYHTSTSRERVNPYVHQQGCRQFQPWEAVDYVRQINGLRFGGYDRDRHVAQLFAAILTKATRTVEITDVAAIDGILRAVGDSLVVDTGNIPMNDLVSSVRPALRLDPVEIATPLGGFHSKVIDGRSYQTVDQVTEQFYTALREDRVAAWVAERGTR